MKKELLVEMTFMEESMNLDGTKNVYIEYTEIKPQ